MNNLPLTFKEQAAIAALQALINSSAPDYGFYEEFAQAAVKYAEALEAALQQHYCNCCMTERLAVNGCCNVCGSTNLMPIGNFSEEVCKLA